MGGGGNEGAEPQPFRTAYDFNAPKTDLFLVNRRGQKMHCRTYLPKSTASIKATVVYFHGYAAHTNGPSMRALGEALTDGGLAVVMADMIGHGYSDGARVLIEDYNDIVDDGLDLIEAATSSSACDGEKCHLGLDGLYRQAMGGLPFFVGGQSMGGGQALLLGQKLRAQKAERFLGGVLLCPAIAANPPPAPVVFFLRYCIAPWIPWARVPQAIERVSVPSLIWTNPRDALRGELDKWGNPGGLGWGHTMRYITGMSLIDMIAELKSSLSKVDFPFLVLHDPEDGIVRFEGTRMLRERASTPDSIPRGKEVKEMPGKKHDLLSNAMGEVHAALLDWMDAHVQAWRPSASSELS